MKRSAIYRAAAAAFVAAGIAACSSSPEGWSIKGQLPSLKEGDKVAVEAFNATQGIWYGVDSIEAGKDGQIAYTAATPSPYPDIYRLSLGKEAIYFPIDSAETVTVTGGKKALMPARVSGTPLAEKMAQVDSLLAVTPASADSLLKRRLTETILADQNGLIAYYIITKQRQGRSLFDTNDRHDLAIVGAVANKFATIRPDDPRTQLLKDVYLKNRAQLPEVKANAATIEAQTTGLFDISLYDREGRRHSLKEEASRGRVVLLSFVAYGHEGAPAYTALLRRLWDGHHDTGLDIFQVSIDPDEGLWRQSTERLPWTAVYNSPADGSRYLASYNVTSVPATFIINRQGDIAERVTDPEQLASALQKYL